MITNVVDTLMNRVNEHIETPVPFDVSWVNDWSAHLQPLLHDPRVRHGVPLVPAAVRAVHLLDSPAQFRCRRFFFSEPLFEVPILLFVRQDSNLSFNRDNDIHGLTMCRPAGYSTFILGSERPQLAEGPAGNAVDPQTITQCFDLLLDGALDAVVMNEFTGRANLAASGRTSQVRIWTVRSPSMSCTSLSARPTPTPVPCCTT